MNQKEKIVYKIIFIIKIENEKNYTTYTIKRDEGNIKIDNSKTGIMSGKDYHNEEFGCQLPDKFVSLNYISIKCDESSIKNITKEINEKISELFEEDSYSFTRDGDSNDVYTYNNDKVGDKKYGQLVTIEASGILEDASSRTVPVIVALLAVILLLI